ncbi:maleylpyruvate isomerase family mycothiol-dependent enzyme [Kocuria sp. TGY1127_2]|uniref:maleylpyruvate isomerase family mycothiol-dependent enzyme n=1 Tax=Kocuria sp. TGY1127_2 TaxID=2711328 RepID=UPI0015B973B6|nr:maleylpyruvate isomerase family mycothiol-dependent enzyme [Kocuria sp. TGY1127_2]
MSAITDLRNQLVEVLQKTGPGKPTLCEGWNTEHMVAHLLLRETRPDIAAGAVLSPLAARTERKTEELAEKLTDGRLYMEAVEKFAQAKAPNRMHGTVDEGMNYVEYVVHREDVLRGSPAANEMNGGESRIDHEDEKIWKTLSSQGKMFSKSYPDGLTIVGTDDQGSPVFGRETLRKPAEASRVSGLVQKVVKAPSTGEQVTITGTPLEILLYLFGRREAAEVEVEY